MSDVVDLAGARAARSTNVDGSEQMACPSCGGVWWRTPGVVFAADGMAVEAFGYPLDCIGCDFRLVGDGA